MTRNEAIRQAAQTDTLRNLGFTKAEVIALRRISMTLQRWHELEAGTGDVRVSVSVERDETGKPFRRFQYATQAGWVDRSEPIADREAGAKKRLAALVQARNARITYDSSADAELNIHATCKAKIAGPVQAYIQRDPRGAALYILRSGDVPEGESPDSYYNRGVCIY